MRLMLRKSTNQIRVLYFMERKKIKDFGSFSYSSCYAKVYVLHLILRYHKPMAAFSRKSNFCNSCKILEYNYTFRFNEELWARPIILKNFTTVAKLLSLLNAATNTA